MNSTLSSDDTSLPLIPVLVGPTAIGKTSLALDLADRFNLEIISCDSRQIYKYLNIGTAKPTAAELGGRAYHLIDFVDPVESYSAARYRSEAERTIHGVFAKGKSPFIVGGTGLYLKALTEGFFATPEPDPEFRERMSRVSAESLHRLLSERDPQAAESIPVGNKIRTIRALEIHELTGRSKTELEQCGYYPEKKYRYLVFGLSCSRQKLYQFINLRVDKMIEEGLVAEVQDLCAKGYADSPVLQSTLGYREILAYLIGENELKESISLIKQRTRNYAKRQITWFKKIPGLTEIDSLEPGSVGILEERFDKFNLDT